LNIGNLLATPLLDPQALPPSFVADLRRVQVIGVVFFFPLQRSPLTSLFSPTSLFPPPQICFIRGRSLSYGRGPIPSFPATETIAALLGRGGFGSLSLEHPCLPIPPGTRKDPVPVLPLARYPLGRSVISKTCSISVLAESNSPLKAPGRFFSCGIVGAVLRELENLFFFQARSLPGSPPERASWAFRLAVGSPVLGGRDPSEIPTCLPFSAVFWPAGPTFWVLPSERVGSYVLVFAFPLILLRSPDLGFFPGTLSLLGF